MQAMLANIAKKFLSSLAFDKENRGKLLMTIPVILVSGVVLIAVIVLIIFAPVLAVINFFADMFSGTAALAPHPYQEVAKNIGCEINYFDMNTVNLFESYVVVLDNPSQTESIEEGEANLPELEARFRKYYFDKSTVIMPGDSTSQTYCKLRFVTDIMDDMKKDAILTEETSQQLTIQLKQAMTTLGSKPFEYEKFTDANYKFAISSHFTNYEFQSSVNKESDEIYAFSSSVDGHRGIDYAIPVGTPITAVMEGRVVAVHDGNPNTGLDGSYDNPKGNFITVLSQFPMVEDKTKANVMISYLHLSPGLMKVAIGDEVAKGQVIASSGHSGQSTGAHLDLRGNYTILATKQSTVWFDPYSITLNDLWMHPVYSTYEEES